MQHQSLTKYADYLKEKAGINLLEVEHGFITFEIGNSLIHIHDIYVSPSHRRKGVGNELVKMAIQEGKKVDCRWLSSTIQINSNDLNMTLITQLAYGFRVVGANERELKLVKEI